MLLAPEQRRKAMILSHTYKIFASDNEEPKWRSVKDLAKELSKTVSRTSTVEMTVLMKQQLLTGFVEEKTTFGFADRLRVLFRGEARGTMNVKMIESIVRPQS